MTSIFYKNLLKLRQRSGYTQDQVAKVIDVSRPTYIQVEQGKRDLTMTEAKKLAKLYQMDLNEFSDPLEHEVIFTKGDKKKIQNNASGEMRISIPQKNLEKFKEVLLYILEKMLNLKDSKR